MTGLRHPDAPRACVRERQNWSLPSSAVMATGPGLAKRFRSVGRGVRLGAKRRSDPPPCFNSRGLVCRGEAENCAWRGRRDDRRRSPTDRERLAFIVTLIRHRVPEATEADLATLADSSLDISWRRWWPRSDDRGDAGG